MLLLVLIYAIVLIVNAFRTWPLLPSIFLLIEKDAGADVENEKGTSFRWKRTALEI